MLYPEPLPQKYVPEFRFSPKPNRASDIRWRVWSHEAFEDAKRQNKPVLLSISAIWCHWCHVMDETTYSNEDVINLLNEQYIPIRVDADKRPDIQNRYLMGGWPTAAILTETGEAIGGGTYIPPGQFKQLLEQATVLYNENREQILEEAAGRRDQIVVDLMERSPSPYPLDKNMVGRIENLFINNFDPQFGGFGEAPKFPNPAALELLLRRAYLDDNRSLLEPVIVTLDNMADGGLFDNEWSGFFRYSTKRDWSEPHYEKLLMDNAEFIVNYLHAYQVSDHINYRGIAEKTLEYVDAFLTDKENGGFFGSQDADEEFYRLGSEDRFRANIPYIDPIIYVDTNAAMISAYIEAHNIFGDNGYLDFATKTMGFLLRYCYSRDHGMAHYFDGEPRFLGLLTDQAYTIKALLDLYGATGKRSFLEKAETLAQTCDRTLRAKDGTFFDKARDLEAGEAGALVIRAKPLGENSILARQLHRLAYITGKEHYEQTAEQVLSNIEIDNLDASPDIALYALALDEILTLPVVLMIVGTREETGMLPMLREAFKRYIPGKEIVLLNPVDDYELIDAKGLPIERHPVLYPCIGRMCLTPVETAKEFKAIVDELPGRSKH